MVIVELDIMAGFAKNVVLDMLNKAISFVLVCQHNLKLHPQYGTLCWKVTYKFQNRVSQEYSFRSVPFGPICFITCGCIDFTGG